MRRYFLRAGAAHPDQLGDWCDAWLERIAVLYRAHHALAAAAPGTGAREDAEGRWQRAFADIDAHRVLQASDAGKGLLHPAAAKVIATLTSQWDGPARPPRATPGRRPLRLARGLPAPLPGTRRPPPGGGRPGPFPPGPPEGPPPPSPRR